MVSALRRSSAAGASGSCQRATSTLTCARRPRSARLGAPPGARWSEASAKSCVPEALYRALTQYSTRDRYVPRLGQPPPLPRDAGALQRNRPWPTGPSSVAVAPTAPTRGRGAQLRGPSESPLTPLPRTGRGPVSPRRIFVLTCGFADSEALRRGSREGEGLSCRGAGRCLRIVVHERSRGEAVGSTHTAEQGKHP